MKGNEKWKKINGYEFQYSVSSYGRVKNHKTNKILSLKKHTTSCYVVNLWKNNKYKTFRVHRLVAAAFLKNPENKETVNHIDGDRYNNKLSNLEWNTFSENSQHSYDVLKRRPPFLGRVGKKHPRSKPVALIRNCKVVETYESARQAALAKNICSTSVAKAAKKGCRAGGESWVYV